eukprot:GEZU01026491.1.p1 GENE.GEZU01026491.1~~GEZU01026491.1.p1  ORF type:complete len:667 (-),score=245.88 GEZU01026491.1:68-2041(-)
MTLPPQAPAAAGAGGGNNKIDNEIELLRSKLLSLKADQQQQQQQLQLSARSRQLPPVPLISHDVISTLSSSRTATSTVIPPPLQVPTATSSFALSSLAAATPGATTNRISLPTPSSPSVAAAVGVLNAESQRFYDNIQRLKTENQALFLRMEDAKNPQVKMQLARKIAENLHLQEMQQKYLEQERLKVQQRFAEAKQKSDIASRQREMRIAMKKLITRGASIRRFSRQKSDRWQEFVSDNFHYEENNKNLKEYDKQWMDKLNQKRAQIKAKQQTSGKSAPGQQFSSLQDAPFASADVDAEAELDALEEEYAEIARTHLFMILRSESHALHQLILSFVKEIQNEYPIAPPPPSHVIGGDGSVLTSKQPPALSRKQIANMASDINAFADNLLVVLFGTFPALDTEEGENVAMEEIRKYLFSLLYDNHIVPLYKRAAAIISGGGDFEFEEVKSWVTPKHLRIPKRFRMEDLDEPYRAAIDKIESITAVASPEEKLNVLLETSNTIYSCIQQYHKQRKGGSNNNNDNAEQEQNEEELMLSADDMLPIFTYVVLKAKNVRDICIAGYFMEDFGDESLSRGSLGYSLCTLVAAMELIKSLTTKELQRNYMNITQEEEEEDIRRNRLAPFLLDLREETFNFGTDGEDSLPPVPPQNTDPTSPFF